MYLCGASFKCAEFYCFVHFHAVGEEKIEEGEQGREQTSASPAYLTLLGVGQLVR